MCAKAVSSKFISTFSVVPWGGAAFNATHFSRQELLNKHSRYIMMKDIRLSIAQGHFNSCDLIPTIIHPCGIVLLAQASPKMPCIYTSIDISNTDTSVCYQSYGNVVNNSDHTHLLERYLFWSDNN